MCTRLATMIAAAAMLPALGGCETTFLSVSTDGRIDIVVSSSGDDRDTDGFTVIVDGGAGEFVPTGGTITVTGVSAGTHSVRLTGIAGNCRVEGDNPRSVLVGSDGRASVRFEVDCALAATGGFLIVVRTSGRSADPDGYRLSVAGEPIREIGVNASESYDGLAPGLHLVQLKNVDPPCVVEGANPRPATVARAQMVTVELKVICGPGQDTLTAARAS